MSAGGWSGARLGRMHEVMAGHVERSGIAERALPAQVSAGVRVKRRCRPAFS